MSKIKTLLKSFISLFKKKETQVIAFDNGSMIVFDSKKDFDKYRAIDVSMSKVTDDEVLKKGLH